MADRNGNPTHHTIEGSSLSRRRASRPYPYLLYLLASQALRPCRRGGEGAIPPTPTVVGLPMSTLVAMYHHPREWADTPGTRWVGPVASRTATTTEEPCGARLTIS